MPRARLPGPLFRAMPCAVCPALLHLAAPSATALLCLQSQDATARSRKAPPRDVARFASSANHRSVPTSLGASLWRYGSNQPPPVTWGAPERRRHHEDQSPPKHHHRPCFFEIRRLSSLPLQGEHFSKFPTTPSLFSPIWPGL
jgi:hypothetical protein